MKMTRLEKLLVNREAKGAANIEMVRQRLQQLDVGRMLDALEIGAPHMRHHLTLHKI